jgi:hypothetical protein
VSRERADHAAAWGTGVGLGFIALMVTWLIGNRLAALIWDGPVGPSLALGAAVVVGISTGAVAGRRLSRAPGGVTIRKGLRRKPEGSKETAS